MISWCQSKGQATETPDEAVVDISCRQSVWPLSDHPRADDNYRCARACMLCTEDEKLINDSISSNEKLLQKELCSSSHKEDHIEKIKEFQSYVDTVKKIARPGCAPETLNVALSLISTLLKTLSAISSKQYMHSSL